MHIYTNNCAHYRIYNDSPLNMVLAMVHSTWLSV